MFLIFKLMVIFYFDLILTLKPEFFSNKLLKKVLQLLNFTTDPGFEVKIYSTYFCNNLFNKA